jgi:hypothetical protein
MSQLISGLETKFSAWNNLSQHLSQLISAPEITYLSSRDNLFRLPKQYILAREISFCIKDNLSQRTEQLVSVSETIGLNINLN